MSKGEQLLNEISIRDMSNLERWAPRVRPECEYEDEVCYEATINEVSDVVNSIKADRQQGWIRCSVPCSNVLSTVSG